MKKVISREYKAMLRADAFIGAEAQLTKAARSFWRDLSRVIQPIEVEVDGTLEDIAKRRTVTFYDTRDHLLRRNDYVFRERKDLDNDEREVTLKCRHVDRYFVQDRDMSAKNNGKTKFEEDIKPPFLKLYSFSTKQEISQSKKLNNMKDPGKLYPGLPEKLDNYDEDEDIRPVGAFTATELVISGGVLEFDDEMRAEAALVVWYETPGPEDRPVVAEFSFKYGDDDEEYPGEVARRAYAVFEVLQRGLSTWIDPDAKTKTAYVYSRAARDED